MSEVSDKNMIGTTTDPERFCDVPTLASDGDTGGSVFNLPTEIFPVGDGDLPSPNVPQSTCYNITHELASGGYGCIWNGVQKNLKRRVALKSLKKEVAEGPQFERISKLFCQEALTTAYLQHPNVVPVYDLTTDLDGRPLVVMKLIEGRQWNRILSDDFSKLPALEFLEVHLPILISAARAVAFAHSKGIIHRDIKPSQVMVGNYGEVVLMDWGLAMAARDSDGQVLCDAAVITDAQSSLVKPMSPAGTPGYMAPEQMEKDVSGVGPWTDIYLLGAVLYELLTGLLPHESSRDNSNGKSPFPALGTIIKPESRTPDRDIPAQLSALAMKAMSRRPSERVPSASEFANELQDYLVKAGRRGESMALVTEVANTVISCEHTYGHLQDWLDKLDSALATWPENQMAIYLRHQTLVTFSRTALANHDLKLARHQAERIHLCHERNNILAEIEVAEKDYRSRDARMHKAHKQAQEDRERAESLVRFLLLDLHSELRSIGRADLVYQVATHALNFFDSLQEAEINSETLQNRAIAYLQIGDVLSEQARRSDAEMAYSRALDITQGLIQTDPENIEWQILNCRCLKALGWLHYIMGRTDPAKQEFEQALTIIKDLKYKSSDKETVRRLYSQTLHHIAQVFWRIQDHENALEKIEEALLSARMLHEESPGDLDFQDDLARVLAARVNILRDTGDLPGALSSAYESLALCIALSEQSPGNAARTEEVFWVRAGLGSLLLITGDLEGALDNLRQDLAARRRLHEEDSDNALRTIGLTFHLSLLAEVNFLLHKVDEAERLMTECLVHSQHIATQDSGNPTVVSRYGHHLVQMAEIHAANGQWEAAERLASQALERTRYSYWMSPQNAVVLQPLIGALALSARLATRAGKQIDAQQFRNEALNIYGQLLGETNFPHYRALKARITLGDCSDKERTSLAESLGTDRRLDPYLTNWLQEISQKSQATS